MLNNKLCLGYCPIGNGSSTAPFNRLFREQKDISRDGFEGVDAVVFWGGTDIHPSLYDEKPHPRNQVANFSWPSHRDDFEWKAMAYCIIHGIPMIGVCRGAQMLCAKAGGYLIQDVTNHNQDHEILTSTGEKFYTTSCHHQMMYPFDVEHELLAWASPSLSKYYQGADDKVEISGMKDKPEPEIVYFPQITGLAIQGHPEWAVKSRFAEYCLEQISAKLLAVVV